MTPFRLLTNPSRLPATSSRLPANLFLLLAILLAALALRTGGLDRWSLWYDEAYCWWVASRVSLREMLSLSAQEVIPPFYYLLLRAWIPLAGATEFALRWPSVLLGVFTVACAGRLAWRLTGRRVGALAAMLLFAVGTPFLWASREVRMYGPALAWTLLADVALLEVFAASSVRRRRFWTWLWAISTLAALYTLALAGFWLVGQALIALVLVAKSSPLPRRLRRHPLPSPDLRLGEGRGWGGGVRPLLLPTLVVGILYLPWAWIATRMAPLNMTYWHGYMPVPYFFRLSLGGLTVMEHIPIEVVETTACLILLNVLLSLAVSRPRLLAGLYPFLYVAPLPLIAWLYQEIPKWGARHASLFAPATFLALAVAWGSVWGIRRRGLRALAVLFIAAATVLNGRFFWEADHNLLTDPAYAREDWRGAARYVQEHRAPGDVVIISTGSVFPAWLYYAGDEGLLPMPDDPLLDVTHVLTYTGVARTLNAALASCSSAPCDPATCNMQPAPCSVWLVAWLDGVTDPTRLVETLLEDVAREEPVPPFRGLKVRRFLLDRPPDFPLEPPTTDRPDAELLPGIRLWGYFLPEGPHPADRPLELRVWWVTDNPAQHTGALYMASFRLQDALGTEWGQDDRIVTDGDYRPERWVPDVPVLGRFFLRLPAGIPPGVYTPTLTLFTRETAGRIALQPIAVRHPASPPEMPVEFTPARSAGASAPLSLLGIHLFQSETAPCRRVTGELFWEVGESLREPYRIVVSAGEHREENPLAPADSQSLLRPGDRIRSYFQLTFPCRALDLEAPLEVRLLRADGSETGGVWYGPTVIVRTERVFAEPTVPYEPVGAEFGPGFATLVGYRLDPPEVRAGEPFTVTLIWRAGFTDDTPRSVFVHIAPPDAPAPLAAQHDGWPAGSARPTHTWVPGEIITDPHPLPGLPAGKYQIRVGLYAPDGERMPVTLGPETPPDRALSFPLEIR